jgi:hypothetical protein
MEADWHDWNHLDRPTDELGAPLPPGGEEAGSRVEGIASTDVVCEFLVLSVAS